MNVTIKDVAKAAGVSVATVSRVLNKSATVSEAAAEQVNNAIKELGYNPNFLGRNLRKCETNVILAILPSTEHSFYNEIIKGMQSAASENGYDILLCTSNSMHSTESRMLGMLYNRTVDAAVMLGTQLSAEELNELNEKHYIAICCERVEGANVLTVTVDDESGAYTAVKNLISLGHRKIAIISTEGMALSSKDREHGYIKALNEFDIPVKEEYIYRGTYDPYNGGKAFEQFMALPEPPTAIFCISDLLAAGTMKKAISNGYKIGEDISVCGFDNIQMCELYNPGITTIEQPAFEIGKTVINELVKNIKQNQKKGRHIKLNYRLIQRESVQKAK